MFVDVVVQFQGLVALHWLSGTATSSLPELWSCPPSDMVATIGGPTGCEIHQTVCVLKVYDGLTGYLSLY